MFLAPGKQARNKSVLLTQHPLREIQGNELRPRIAPGQRAQVAPDEDARKTSQKKSLFAWR